MHPDAQTCTAEQVSELIPWLAERADEHAANVAEWVKEGQQARGRLAGGACCQRDTKIGTNKHVFAILGPHFGLGYGNICIVLKQTIMYEPDFDISPCAGTGFLSQRARIFNTWLDAGRFKGVAGADQFHMARLNAGVLGWRSVMSAALSHAVRGWLRQKGEAQSFALSDVKESHVIDFLSSINSHCAIEAHLPGTVPLFHYTERVVIPQSEYDQLSHDEQLRLEKLVGLECIVKVDNTTSPAAILAHCLGGLDAAAEEGFHVFLLPELPSPDGYRLLRAVQPRCATSASLRLKLSGVCQLMLGPADGQSSQGGVSFIFGRLPLSPGQSPVELVGQKGFVEIPSEDLHEDMFERDGPVGRASPKQLQCWLVGRFPAPRVGRFALERDEQGFVHLRATLGDSIEVHDEVKGQVVLSMEGGSAALRMTRVAVKAAHTRAEIRALKVM